MSDTKLDTGVCHCLRTRTMFLPEQEPHPHMEGFEDEGDVSPRHERPHPVVIAVSLPPEGFEGQGEPARRSTADEEHAPACRQGSLYRIGQAIDGAGVLPESAQRADVHALEHRQRPG